MIWPKQLHIKVAFSTPKDIVPTKRHIGHQIMDGSSSITLEQNDDIKHALVNFREATDHPSLAARHVLGREVEHCVNAVEKPAYIRISNAQMWFAFVTQMMLNSRLMILIPQSLYLHARYSKQL